jgi:1-acyl-sn-glycerol-3-phosphate acyltransferase
VTASAAKPATRLEMVTYRFVRGAVVGFCRLFWRMTVKGIENVPRDRAFILSPVHRSNIDTPLVAVVTNRRLHYMGKDSMWKIKPVGRFFTAMGSFPVHRETRFADREALRQCIEVLQSGEPLVMFPEGTRREGPVVEDLFEGPAYIAMKVGAPIVPVGIGGSERAMPRGSKFIKPVKTAIVIGPPIEPDPTVNGKTSRRAVKALTEQLRGELQRLFDEAKQLAGDAS